MENIKERFTENVQQWVTIDTQLLLLNEKTKKLREQKNRLSNEITSYMKEKINTQENMKPKIQISDGELRIYNKKEYTPLSFTYIEKCLVEIIPDKSHVEYILQHLKNKREVKDELDIKRIFTK
jgi:hypothetical protein